MNWHDFNNKRILGTVPVEQDGSAYFSVPADRFVYFQLLDENGMMVQSMRSGTCLHEDNDLVVRMIRDHLSADCEEVLIDTDAAYKKAVGYFRYRGMEPLASYRDISDRPTFTDAKSIAAHVIGGYEAEEIDAVYVVFNHFKNVAEQKPEVHQLLPIERRVMDEAVEDGTDEEEKEAPPPPPVDLKDPDDLNEYKERQAEAELTLARARLLTQETEILRFQAELESAAANLSSKRWPRGSPPTCAQRTCWRVWEDRNLQC